MLLLKRIVIGILLLLVLIFGMAFSVQNTAPVPLDLLLIQLSEQSVALWVLLAFALGGLSGIAVSMVAIIRLRGGQRTLRRQIKKNKGETK